MDNYKSYEFTFLYLINKCILLFNFIEIDFQKEILSDIKNFINKLKEIFSGYDIEERKYKILEVLISFFEKLIDEKIYGLIKNSNKDKIISDIEQKALLMCEESENKKKNEMKNEMKNDMKNDIKKINFNELKLDSNELEKKINSKIKFLFSEIETNIKKSLKDYLIHLEFIESDLNQKILENNFIIENKIKDIVKENITVDENQIYDNVKDYIKNQIVEIYNYINDKISMNSDINNKITLLADIFNENIQKIYENLNNKLINNEKDFLNLINQKINIDCFNKNNFRILYDKDDQEIKLFYYNELITSSKINIKGLIGPKGPQGNKGDTPLIRKIKITEDNKIKFIIQENNNNIYEIISDNNLPQGPQGIKGERGDPGKCIMDLKWNQDNVMRIDENNEDSIIFLKSLCIGDKSHCVKENSISVAGGKCYQNNSFSIGNNAKSLDSDSIALFGSTIGKKSFSYRADNVDENSLQMGKKEGNNYNIISYNIISKEINFECDSFKIKCNKYENNKIKELEERINLLEKKFK